MHVPTHTCWRFTLSTVKVGEEREGEGQLHHFTSGDNCTKNDGNVVIFSVVTHHFFEFKNNSNRVKEMIASGVLCDYTIVTITHEIQQKILKDIIRPAFCFAGMLSS